MFIVGTLLKKPRSGGSEIQSPWCDNALTGRDQAWARAFHRYPVRMGTQRLSAEDERRKHESDRR
jgi:hypothetical protein